jgi:hypothetical protein
MYRMVSTSDTLKKKKKKKKKKKSDISLTIIQYMFIHCSLRHLSGQNLNM